MENLERRIGSLLDIELKYFEFLWRLFLDLLGIHAGPPVVFWNFNVLEICDEHVAIVLDNLTALGKDLLQHIIRVDECSHCVGEDDTIHFLWQLEVLVENIEADQFEFVDHFQIG